MIEEVPESSWAAIEIPAKHGNLVFDFSEIADKFELALSSPSDHRCQKYNSDIVQNIKVDSPPPLTLNDEEEEEVYVNAYAAAHSYRAIIFDSGCSTHMTPLTDELRNQREIPTRVIQAANAETFTANISGTLHLGLPTFEQ